MFIVEEDLFSYNKCTFSHSGSIDSDFDCVHFTFQGFFSLVCGSPGKTINSWIHWQQILQIHNPEMQGYLYLHYYNNKRT